MVNKEFDMINYCLLWYIFIVISIQLDVEDIYNVHKLSGIASWYLLTKCCSDMLLCTGTLMIHSCLSLSFRIIYFVIDVFFAIVKCGQVFTDYISE